MLRDCTAFPAAHLGDLTRSSQPAAPALPGTQHDGSEPPGLALSRSLCLSLHSRLKPQKRPGGGASQPCENIVVAYYFCGEPIPYRTLVKGRVVTLGQFKELLTKKGNYR